MKGARSLDRQITLNKNLEWGAGHGAEQTGGLNGQVVVVQHARHVGWAGDDDVPEAAVAPERTAATATTARDSATKR
jgi:hypothetical protein